MAKMVHDSGFFGEQIEIVRKWLAVHGQPDGDAAATSETAQVADSLVELGTALEELQAANEELYEQNQELIATRQAEEAERRRYQDQFDFAPDGYLVTDPQGVIREANRAASVMLRTYREFLGGKPLLLFLAPEERRTFLIKLAQLQAEGGLQSWEFLLQPRASSAFPVAATVLAGNGPNGQVVNLRWLLRDITEAKRAEAELQQYRTGLETLVEKRTAELHQEIAERRLVEAQLKLALREKEVLLQEIHHRVRNNLQLIFNLLELQSATIQDPTLLHIFQDNKDRLRSIIFIHDYLYQSQALTAIDLTKYIRGIVSHLDRAYNIQGKLVRLKVQVAHVSLGLHTAAPCGLIITELVSNALKYAFPPAWYEAEGRDAEIIIRLRKRKNGQLTLLVSDNGIGLPPDVDVNKPSSLGLQLVTMLTQQLKGTLELDRTNGAAFKLTWIEDE